MWNNLSMKQNHELASLPACWQARCGRRIEAHLPASSPEVSDDDQTMEDVSTTSRPAPVHASFTMK